MRRGSPQHGARGPRGSAARTGDVSYHLWILFRVQRSGALRRGHAFLPQVFQRGPPGNPPHGAKSRALSCLSQENTKFHRAEFAFASFHRCRSRDICFLSPSRSSTVDAAAVPPSHAQSRREPAAARAPAGEAALASPGVPLPRPAPAVANPFRDGHPGAFPRFRCDAGTAPPPWQGTGGVTGGGRPVQVPGGGCPKIHAAMRPAADSSAAPSDPDPDAMEVEATEAEEAP